MMRTAFTAFRYTFLVACIGWISLSSIGHETSAKAMVFACILAMWLTLSAVMGTAKRVTTGRTALLHTTLTALMDTYLTVLAMTLLRGAAGPARYDICAIYVLPATAIGGPIPGAAAALAGIFACFNGIVLASGMPSLTALATIVAVAVSSFAFGLAWHVSVPTFRRLLMVASASSSTIPIEKRITAMSARLSEISEERDAALERAAELEARAAAVSLSETPAPADDSTPDGPPPAATPGDTDLAARIEELEMQLQVAEFEKVGMQQEMKELSKELETVYISVDRDPGEPVEHDTPQAAAEKEDL